MKFNLLSKALRKGLFHLVLACLFHRWHIF